MEDFYEIQDETEIDFETGAEHYLKKIIIRVKR